MLHIAHLTDLHLSSQENLKAKFQSLIESLPQKIDAIIITGDILGDPLDSKEEEKDLYNWVKEHLDSSQKEYFISPGNHDNPLLLKSIFNEKDKAPHVISTGAIALKGESLIFLDSHLGRIPLKEANWFKRELETQPESSFLFTHYPLIQTGLSYYDKNSGCLDETLIKKIVKDSGKTLTIICGHYHIDYGVSNQNIYTLITPGLEGIREKDPIQKPIKIINKNPSWRHLIIEKQKLIQSDLITAEGLNLL